MPDEPTVVAPAAPGQPDFPILQLDVDRGYRFFQLLIAKFQKFGSAYVVPGTEYITVNDAPKGDIPAGAIVFVVIPPGEKYPLILSLEMDVAEADLKKVAHLVAHTVASYFRSRRKHGKLMDAPLTYHIAPRGTYSNEKPIGD